jgi:hypothetical protein
MALSRLDRIEVFLEISPARQKKYAKDIPIAVLV